MSLFSRGQGIRAASIEDPAVPLNGFSVMLDLLGFSQSDAGIVINERQALRLSAVQACVRVIAETLASLPLNVYQHVGKGKVEARSHRVWPLLHDAPNPQMTAMIFREAVTAQVLLWGNGYAEIQRDRAGRVVALWPLSSERTRPIRQGGVLRYETEAEAGADAYPYQIGVNAPAGQRRVISPDDILHVPGLSFNGLLGMSPIRLAAQTIGLSAAAERFGSLFFGSGSRPSGILSHPGRLREEARTNLEKSFTRATSRENAQKAIVLEEGVTWTAMSVPPDEAQFLETREFQIAEIARIFRVPLHLIQDLSNSTNNNIEQQSIEFVMHTVRPWAIRWEQELLRKLLGGPFFPMHDIRGLLRGDFQSRMAGYQILRNAGVISTNDIREAEGWNPVSEEEGGDVLLAPLNMTSLESLAKQEDEPEPAPGGPPPDQDQETSEDGGGDGTPDDPNAALQRARMVGAFGRLFQDGAGRAVKRERRDGKAMRAIFAPAMIAMAEGLVALEFPYPAPLSGVAQQLISGHTAAIAQRAGAWKASDRHEAGLSEARRAYDLLRSNLAVLMEAK